MRPANLTQINEDDVSIILSDWTPIAAPITGGQKVVFPSIYKGKQYALKVIKINKSDADNDEDTEEQIRCEREIGTLLLCDSPYLIKIGPMKMYETKYQGEDLLFFSEEWINGYDLLRHLKDHAPINDNSELIKIGIDISYAIEELWSHHKIHRDIKPQNIMYSIDEDIYKLLDMGMVYDSTYDSLTKYAFIVGTPGYYSPEQLQRPKNELDFRSDLFCLGIVLYQLCTGIHPFFNRDINIIFKNIIELSPKSPQIINPDISDKLSNTILRLLKKRPSERYRNCELLRQDLEKSAMGKRR